MEHRHAEWLMIATFAGGDILLGCSVQEPHSGSGLAGSSQVANTRSNGQAGRLVSAGSSGPPGMDGSSGSNGLPDAAGSAGAGVAGGAASLPEHVLAALTVARLGGEADFNNDGIIDMVSIREGGRRVVSLLGRTGPVLTVTRESGRANKQGDFNEDGTPDYFESEVVTEISLTRETEQDADFDGVLEARHRFDLDHATNEYRYVKEVLAEDALGNSVWTIVADFAGSGSTPQNGGGSAPDCNPLQGYPPEGHTDEETVVGNIRIAHRRQSEALSGACTEEQARRIRTELESLFRNTLDELTPLDSISNSSSIHCLARRDPVFLEAMVEAIVNGHGARIGCGGGCPSVYGATDLGTPRVNLNLTEIGASGALLRGTILHELIHAAGYSFRVGQVDHHNVTDSVYACERWCSGTAFKSLNSSGQLVYDLKGTLDMNDCFRCSGTLRTKQECCGEQTVCVGGCCKEPCDADGRCPDACDLARVTETPGGCMYAGTATTAQPLAAVVATVTWRFDRIENDEVVLTPSGVLDIQWNYPGFCTLQPVSATLDQSDGELHLGVRNNPRTYTGVGIKELPITLTCCNGGECSQTTATTSLTWFWIEPGTEYPFDPQLPLADQFTMAYAESRWVWTRR